MGGQAKSDVDKDNARQCIYEALMVQAIAAYKADQKKTKKDRHGYRKICLDFESLHFEETGMHINFILNDIQIIFSTGNQIKLCHMTLKQHVAGGMTCERANAEPSWLTDSEVNIVCTFQSPPNSCRMPQDSAELQAKVLILVASPAKLGRVGQSLEELGRT